MNVFGGRCKTMSKYIFVYYVYVLSFVMSHAVQAEGFDYYAQVNKYAKCEAVLNVMANILSESEEEFYNHEQHHASLDARVVALELAKAGNFEQAMVGEIYNTYLNEYRDQLKLSEDVEKFIVLLRPHVKKCRRLNDMQSDIIARKKKQYLENDDLLK